MNAKKFLQEDKRVNAAEIARLMWPGNKTAKTYLSRKLAGSVAWTDKDEAKARDVLHQLGVDVGKL